MFRLLIYVRKEIVRLGGDGATSQRFDGFVVSASAIPTDVLPPELLTSIKEGTEPIILVFLGYHSMESSYNFNQFGKTHVKIMLELVI